MKTTMKKVLSMVMALVLVLGILPMAAFAEETHAWVQGATEHTCSVEGCTEHTAAPHFDNNSNNICDICDYVLAAEHTCAGGTATCAAPAVCAGCGAAYGEKNAANHTGGTEVRGAVAVTTCGVDGYTGDTYCLGCETVIGPGSVINAPDHIGETEVRDAVAATCKTAGYTGDTYCLACGEKTATGTATEKSTTHGDTMIINRKEATETQDGYTGDTVCKVCEQVIGNGEVIPATGKDEPEEEPAKKYTITFKPNYDGASSTKVTVEEGTAIYGLYNPKRAGYTFVGWYKDIKLTKALDEEAVATKSATYYAKWKQNYPHEVYVKFYVNGNTSTVAKYVDLHDYAQDGIITLKELKYVAYEVFEQANDIGLSVYGPFNSTQWEKYCLDDYYRDTDDKIFVNSDSKTVIYAMVHNVKDYNNGGSNKGPVADSTNPKTGDEIFVPVAVMGLSVSALAVLFYLNKKRAF